MQTATGTLAAAIAAPEQQPVHTVTVDWDGDGINSVASLIPDGDFELGSGLASWSGYVPGGSFVRNSTFRDVASSASIPETGGTAPTAQSGSKMRFVAFGVPGATGGMHGIRLATTIGQQYTATFRVQIPTAPASGTVLRLRAWDRGALVADSTTTSTTASWITLTITFQPTSQYTWVGVYATGTAAAQVYAFIDNVAVTPSGTLLTIDDLTDQVSSLEIDQSITTDLPDATQLVTGYAVAELKVELKASSDLRRTAAAQYSPYNTSSPLYGKVEQGSPVAAAFGMRTAAGIEVLPAFTGQVRELTTNVDAPSLYALDPSERMRGRAAVPLLVIDNGLAGGGLTQAAIKSDFNAQAIVDYLARAAGFYASPAPRATCRLSMTCHGYPLPDVGSLESAYGFDGSSGTYFPLTYTDGKFGLALAFAQTTNVGALFGPGPDLTTNNGGTMLLECWTISGVTANTAFSHIQLNGTGGGVFVALRIDSTDHLAVHAQRASGGSVITLTGPVVPRDSAWHYIGAFISFTSTSMDVTWRVDGSSSSGSVASGSVTGQDPLFDAYIHPAWPIEAIQASAETTATWLDSFVPTALIDTSKLILTASPVLNDDVAIWDVLTDIAAAEAGTMYFDESGRFVYRNLDYPRLKANVVQLTMSSRDSLLNATIDRAIDQVLNRIIATVKKPTVGAYNSALWRAPSVFSVPGGQSTVMWADLTSSSAAIAPFAYLMRSLADNVLVSRFTAAANPDGSGSMITSGLRCTLEQFGDTRVKATITNSNAFTAWIVVPAGFVNDTPGQPGLIIAGSPLDWSTTTDTTLDYSDPASVARYREQVYKIPENNWLQDAAGGAAIVQAKLASLRKPRPLITNLEVVGDPRLQLLDRIILTDPDTGLTFGEEYQLFGKRSRIDDSGFTQTLTVRQLTNPNGWVLGRAGRMKLGTQTRLL